MLSDDTIIQTLEDPRVMGITLVGSDGRGVHIDRRVSGFEVWAAHLTRRAITTTAEEAVAAAQDRYFQVRPRHRSKEKTDG